MITMATIETLVKLGILGVQAIQKLRAASAERKLEIRETPDGPVLDAAALAPHWAAWEAAADAASDHASQRIEDRHAGDPIL